jgi:hypothetical protein
MGDIFEVIGTCIRDMRRRKNPSFAVGVLRPRDSRKEG